MTDTGRRRLTRRQFVVRSGLTVVGGSLLGTGVGEALLACGGQSQSRLKPARDLEIYSWWTAGGEADGLNELYRTYHQLYGNVSIKNAAVAGSAGTNARPMLTARMQAGRPPDSFQVHAGQELISTWVRAGKMQPITDIWRSEGWDRVIPRGLRDIVSSDGEVWSVPVNVHRGNVLWYSPRALGEAGVAPPTTIDELIAALGKLRRGGMRAPLALGSKGGWQLAMIFENNVLAAAGPDYYRQLFAGRASFTDGKVKEALAGINRMLDYANPDHASLDWDEACRRLTVGAAAFTIMGDWAKGYFTANGWTVDRDFAVVPSPGTLGSYVVVCDTFGLPKGAPDEVPARAWIKVCGSRDGQAAFNPKKGSIPARTDVPTSVFDPISQRFIEEFKTAALVPSSAHGSATPEPFATGVDDEMGRFVLEHDIAATAANLQKLAEQRLAPG